jgi:peptidyl-prolyl cis-trans isomerase C
MRFTKLFLFVGGLAIGMLLVGCFGKSSNAQKPLLKVNGTEISTLTFSQRLARQMKSYDSLQAKDEANLNRAKLLTEQAFIVEVLTRDFAAKNKLSISPQEITQATKKLRAEYPDDLSFRRALADENLAYEDWEKDVAFSLLQKKVFALVVKDVAQPSENEIKAYYEANKSRYHRLARVRLRQIVVANEDDALRIQRSLAAGGDFTKLAKQFSVAPEAENGGLTDWIEKGSLDVFDMAFKLPIGSRSKILKSAYGYHIFEVLKKEPEAYLSFNEAKDKIRALLKERKDQETFSAWLKNQVQHSSVLRDEGLFRALKISIRGD